MFRSIIRVLTFSAFINSAVIIHRQDVTFHYMPVGFDYGYDSRLTNFTVGTGPNSEPFKIVMDTGSSDFWVWRPEAIVNYGSQYLFELGPCNVTVPTEYDPALSPTSVVISNHSSEYAYGGNPKILQGVNYANDTLTAISGSGPIPNV